MVTSGTRWLAWIGACLLALAGVACGDRATGGDADGGRPGGAGGSGAGGGVGSAGTGGDSGCVSADDCPEGAVCDPKTGQCTHAKLACTGHADCGGGAICVDGTCAPNETGGVCAEDADCPRREHCIGGYCGCMGGRFEADVVVPNVLILLDKSGSMDRSAGPDTKWNIAVRAIESLLDEFGDRIRFGLLLYPRGGGCEVGEVDVPVGPGQGPAILEALARTRPAGSTPIGGALAAVRDEPALADRDRPSYVLLVTDGEERCGGDGEAEVSALRALDPEVKTFVVGFGDGVSASALEAMAVAGGTARAETPAYYQADDEASLRETFSTIGGLVLSCAYAIDDAGLDLEMDDIFVYFDGAPVQADPQEGWRYEKGASRITFHGSSCEKLQTGEVNDLVIVHGCPVRAD